MSQVREVARPANLKRSRLPTGETPQSDATGRYVLLRSGENIAEVPVSKTRFKQIAAGVGALGELISTYADTAARARRTGQSVRVTYIVTPDGKTEAVSDPSAERPNGLLNAAITRAKARGASKIADILKSPDMLTARDFGPLIGASHETVNAKRKRHEVLGLEGATRGVKYPRWQVTDAGLPLPGLARVFEILGSHPWSVYRFLLTEHPELGGNTALDALKSGQVDAVMGVAENLGAGAFS